MNKLIEKWKATGMLDDIPPEQCGEAAVFFNQIAVEIIGSNPKEGTPEYDRFDKLAGIVLPVAHDLFKKFYPHFPAPKWIMEECSAFFDENQKMYEDLKTGIAQDYEQEFGFVCFTALEKKYDERKC